MSDAPAPANSRGDRPQSSRVGIIDMLRGIAALSVTWFHITNGLVDGGLVKDSGTYGWLGVEVFFVISGFIIPTSIAQGYAQFSLRDAPHYMLRRLVRLEPPYLVSIVLVLVLWQLSSLAPSFRGSPAPMDLGQILAHLCYLIPITDYEWLQPVYWTLAYEFAFYIVCGLLFKPVIAQTKTPIVFFAAVSVTIALVLGPMPPRALLFVIGIAVFRHRTLRQSGAVTFAIVGACALAMQMQGMALQAVVGAFAALTIYMFADRHYRRTSLVRLGTWLGAISYSLYLLHVPIGGRVVNLGLRSVDSPIQEVLLAVLALIVSIVAAYTFFRVVERPAIILAKKISPKSNQRGAMR